MPLVFKIINPLYTIPSVLYHALQLRLARLVKVVAHVHGAHGKVEPGVLCRDASRAEVVPLSLNWLRRYFPNNFLIIYLSSCAVTPDITWLYSKRAVLKTSGPSASSGRILLQNR